MTALRIFKRDHTYISFLEILNEKIPAIKYTVELEDHKHSTVTLSTILLIKNANSKNIEKMQSHTYILNKIHAKIQVSPKIVFKILPSPEKHRF